MPRFSHYGAQPPIGLETIQPEIGTGAGANSTHHGSAYHEGAHHDTGPQYGRATPMTVNEKNIDYGNDFRGVVVKSGSEDYYEHDYYQEEYAEENEEEGNGLRRQLKGRHISLLSIGGIIGTGLFLGSGESLRTGGPLGLLMGFAIYGGVLVCVMQGLGEMAAYMPLTGGHLMYAGRFVDPALAFAVNWAYAIQWVLVLASELSAVAVLFNYWVPAEQLSNAVWVTIAWVTVVGLNLFPARVYGESEFIFSSIKVITIIGLVICGVCINLGAGPNGHYIGFKYWHDPGAFAPEYMGLEGALKNFLGFWSVLTTASFSYFGSEIVAVAAAESYNPTRAIPRAIKQVYFRIVLFYVLGTFIIGLNIPSTHPHLGSSHDAHASPFVIAIESAGIKVLPHIINACIISAAWSAANADVYIASRSFFSLAHQGYLPKFFLYTSPQGAPMVSTLFAGMFGALAYMVCSTDAYSVFRWFLSLTSVWGLMIYIVITITYLRFRQACDYQGIDRAVFPFRSHFARAGAWLALFFISCIAFFSGWTVFMDLDNFDAAKFITNYLPLPLLPAFYFGRKLWTRSKILPLDEIDLHTGARHRAECIDDDEVPKGFLGKLYVIFC